MTSTFYFSTNLKYLVDQEMKTLHTKVDLIVTLGGDGTVLWVCTMQHIESRCCVVNLTP